MSTSRILPPQTRTEAFGLFVIIESRRVVLPLKGVECDFSVRGGVAEVCMTQIFRQENRKPLDCEYLFPLPADGSAYSCEAEINGRIIRAEIKERQEARKFVAEKKAEGRRTALVESERDNLFTISLGNVQPDDLVIVRLKYIQPLRTLGALRSIEIPFCPGVRYIPGNPLLRSNRGKGTQDDTNEVPDASRITPVRIDELHPDAAFVDVRGTLDGEFTDEKSVISPSHSVDVKASEGEVSIRLSSRDEVPDRDFVVRWEERNADKIAPRAWIREKGNETYALLEVRAPQDETVQRTALDFYFLVDRSGSMQGQKWEKAVEALQSCVAVLGRDDRAMITFFENRHHDFAEQPLSPSALLVDPQFQGLKRLGATGGTVMAGALQHVLELANAHSQGRERNLILITDAQIGNDAAILRLMKSAPDMPVHCFGIDIALNDALLLALSRQQGGSFHSLNPNDNIQAAVTALGKTLRRPVLLDPQLSEGWENSDARIPNLYAGQILYVSARAGANQPLRLTAKTPAGQIVQYDFQARALAQESPYLHWCKTRIQRWLSEDKAAEAIKLSVASNLLCRLTAFVAWDSSEKVAIATHELVQPSMAPAAAGLYAFSKIQRVARVDDTVHMIVRQPALADLTQEAKENSKGKTRMGFYASAPSNGRILKKEKSSFDLSALTKLFKRHQKVPYNKLFAACQKFGGDDWRAGWEAIATGFERIPGNRERLIEAMHLLIAKLNLCWKLRRAVEESKNRTDLVKRLRLAELEFRALEKKHGNTGQFQDITSLFLHAQGVSETTSDEQVASFAMEIRRVALQMLNAMGASVASRSVAAQNPA